MAAANVKILAAWLKVAVAYSKIGVAVVQMNVAKLIDKTRQNKGQGSTLYHFLLSRYFKGLST